MNFNQLKKYKNGINIYIIKYIICIKYSTKTNNFYLIYLLKEAFLNFVQRFLVIKSIYNRIDIKTPNKILLNIWSNK